MLELGVVEGLVLGELEGVVEGFVLGVGSVGSVIGLSGPNDGV